MARERLDDTLSSARAIHSDCPPYVDEVVAELQKFGLKGQDTSRPLGSFLRGLSQIKGPLALGIVYHHEGHPRPIIHVNILWSSPIDLTLSPQAEEMEQVEALHARFALRVERRVDTFLEFVDPAVCSTAALFAEAVAKWSRQSGGVFEIVCREIPQTATAY